MTKHSLRPQRAPLGGDRARAVARRVLPVLGVVVGLLLALAVYDALSGDTGNTGVGDGYRLVEADPTWLAYLPEDGAVPGLSVAGLAATSTDGPVTRRVDLRVPGVPDGAVTLCFVGFAEDLASACPRARLLGEVERAVGLPIVGLEGPIGALDWLAVYASPVPELDDLDYLRR